MVDEEGDGGRGVAAEGRRVEAEMEWWRVLKKSKEGLPGYECDWRGEEWPKEENFTDTSEDGGDVSVVG